LHIKLRHPLIPQNQRKVEPGDVIAQVVQIARVGHLAGEDAFYGEELGVQRRREAGQQKGQ